MSSGYSMNLHLIVLNSDIFYHKRFMWFHVGDCRIRRHFLKIINHFGTGVHTRILFGWHYFLKQLPLLMEPRKSFNYIRQLFLFFITGIKNKSRMYLLKVHICTLGNEGINKHKNRSFPSKNSTLVKTHAPLIHIFPRKGFLKLQWVHYRDPGKKVHFYIINKHAIRIISIKHFNALKRITPGHFVYSSAMNPSLLKS